MNLVVVSNYISIFKYKGVRKYNFVGFGREKSWKYIVVLILVIEVD